MNRKYILVALGIILFLVLVNVIKNEPLESQKVKEKQVEVKDTEQEESQEINLIDYYNLEGENRALQAEIDDKNQTIFELNKIIVSSGVLDELPEYDDRRVIYKEVSDAEILLFSEDKGGIYEYYFSIMTKDQTYWNIISRLDSNEKINWSALFGLYSGIVQDEEITTVKVYKNEQEFETRIIDVDDGLRLWFVILDYKAKSRNDELDQMKIQALDRNGNVLWEESFENEFDRVG